jgi:hypothetical protein
MRAALLLLLFREEQIIVDGIVLEAAIHTVLAST